ncbi:MAG: ammonium transporter [Terriglobia bacterium]
MITPSSSALPATDIAVCLFSILLVPFALAGLSLINTGLGRSRSAAHAMMASLAVIAAAVITYFVCGFAWQGFAGGPSHALTLGGQAWDWIAAGPFFLRGLNSGSSAAALTVPLIAWFGMFSVALAAVIPLGSGGDRWRLSASCASTVLLAGWTYPLFAHWVWGGGWLARLGISYGLGHGFMDAGGAGAIQAVGGLTALSIAWILGPRRGKYAADGVTAAIPGHNAVYILFGCFMALIGWLGLNSAGAILFTGAGPGRVPLIAMNTALAAGAATLTAALITRSRFGKPDASLSANGWVGGLVASSAVCAFVTPALAVMTGLVAGALVTFSVEWLETKAAVDDPGGSISVHAVCGIWGLLAVGLFARLPGQWLAQVVGVATLLGCVLPLTYGLNWLLNHFFRQRVAVEGERQGMDLHELGAGAYPEFVTHDEFTQW